MSLRVSPFHFSHFLLFLLSVATVLANFELQVPRTTFFPADRQDRRETLTFFPRRQKVGFDRWQRLLEDELMTQKARTCVCVTTASSTTFTHTYLPSPRLSLTITFVWVCQVFKCGRGRRCSVPDVSFGRVTRGRGMVEQF